MKPPQEIIQRTSGINTTKSFALDFVHTFVGSVGQFSFCAWQSRFLQPVQKSVQSQGQQLLHSKYFCHLLGLFKPFVKMSQQRPTQHGKIPFPPSPHFLSLSDIQYTVEKSLIWMFYGFSKLFTNTNKTLYSSDEFLNTRYIMDAVYLFMDEKARAGLQTCIF